MLKITAQVKMIQTARGILGQGEGWVGLNCRGAQQAQVSGTALPQFTPSLRVNLQGKKHINNKEVSA